MNAETMVMNDEGFPTQIASMRPRSVERGDNRAPSFTPFALAASMRPRSVERGDLLDAAEKRLQELASMRPRSVERGDVQDGKLGGWLPDGFNEAAFS